MKRRLFLLLGGLLAAAALRAQSTNSPAGVLYPTQNTARVNGVKIQVMPDGTVWFLESSADIIARLKDGVMRQWQIRPTGQLGANPVDFQIDGDLVWFIESGESQIPAGTSAYARLDTSTGLLTEWVLPTAIPANFYRAPDGLVWIPQSASVLQSLNLDTLEVVSYRSPATFAYGDMVVAPDGAFWLTDFGNNRVVRWTPGSATETSWTFFPVTGGRLNPAQLAFDEQGGLWIPQRSANRVDHFDPVASVFYSYQNIPAPIHLDVFQGRVYITSIAATSQVTVIDPAVAAISIATNTAPQELTVGSTISPVPATVRTTPIVPTDFTSAPTVIDPASFTQTLVGPAGIVTTTFPSSNTYGITIVGGRMWVGTDGQLAVINLQAAGGPTDVAVPIATAVAGAADSKVEISTTLSNRGTGSLLTSVSFLYSNGAFSPKPSFTLAAGATLFTADTFGNLAAPGILLQGPVRIGTTTGTPQDLAADVRSARVLQSGGTFGYLLPADSATTSLQNNSVTTLFTGALATEPSILTLYSLDDAGATLDLYAPDGTLRATQDFDIAKNASLSFNPAASAFGVVAEPGDAVRVNVTKGTLQSSVLVFDAGTTDVFPSLPAPGLSSAVVPWVGSYPNGDRSFTSDLYISNLSADADALITISYFGIGASGAPRTATIELAPLETRVVEDLLQSLFDVTAGQGALTLTSSVPVAASVRIATAISTGAYGTFANALDAAKGFAGGASAFAIGLPQTPTRTGLLLLFNNGSEGAVTINGFKADGSSAGQLTVPIGAQQAVVVPAVFAALGVTSQAAGRVKIDVGAGMNVFGWNAATDDVTGDIDLSPLQ
jgi:streptogramin lyase